MLSYLQVPPRAFAAAHTRYTCLPLVTLVTVPSQCWHFSTPAKIERGSRLELRPRAAVVFKRLFTRSNPPNWPLGSAMALIFMFVLTVAVIFYFRVTTESDRA